jgi:hypothetical protein
MKLGRTLRRGEFRVYSQHTRSLGTYREIFREAYPTR